MRSARRIRSRPKIYASKFMRQTGLVLYDRLFPAKYQSRLTGKSQYFACQCSGIVNAGNAARTASPL